MMLWSLRRELWENRSIYLAPAVVGVLIVLASGISAFALPEAMSAFDLSQHHEVAEQPYMLASLLLMLTAVLVAMYYCLEAFQGERRDRSILFWKSMPVSDLMTVASKASVPVVVIPLIAFAVTVVTQIVMLVVGSIRVTADGGSLADLWNPVALSQMWVMLLYHLVAGHGLWYAPFYGWLLLVSAWARRAPLLWATLPLVVIALLERIAFQTSRFTNLLADRFAASPDASHTDPMSMESLISATPMQYLTSPGFWLGLAFFILCMLAAVRLRRHGSPA
jgi:ABC-2 type transport system permease protein